MGMVIVDEGLGGESQFVCVYRYKVIWSESDIDEEAFASVYAIDFDTVEERASDNGVVKGSGICSLGHLVSGFESASSPLADLEILGGRTTLTSLWSSGDDHHP